MKKIIIPALILGVVLGAFQFIVFAVLKEDLYSNKVLLNTFIVIGTIVVFIVSFFVVKRGKKEK